MNSKLKFEVFESSWDSWQVLCQKACDFADRIGRDNVVNISHSCTNNEGAIMVWYWEDNLSGQMFEVNQVNFGE